MALRSQREIDHRAHVWAAAALTACVGLVSTFDAKNDNAAQFDREQRADINETAVPYAETFLYVEKTAAEKKYPNLRALEFIPVDTELPEDIDEYEYYLRDWVGEFKWASLRAEDFPMVTQLGVKQRGRLDWFHGGYEYWKREIKRAAKAGIPLDASLAKAAYKAAAEFVDKALVSGFIAAGFYGVANNPNVAVDGAGQLPGGGDWGDPATTGESMLSDLLFMIDRIKRVTRSAYSATILILPDVVEEILQTRFVNVGNELVDILTRVKALRTNIKIEFWAVLDTADSGNPRAIAFQQDTDVLRAIVPKPYTTEPPQQDLLAIKVVGEGSCGGVNIRQTAGVRYFDDLIIP